MSESKKEWLSRVADSHGLDPEDIEEIAELCLNDAKENLAILKSFDPGNDTSEVLRSAHSIKGGSANIDLTEINESAKAVEKSLQEEQFEDFSENVKRLEKAVENFESYMES